MKRLLFLLAFLALPLYGQKSQSNVHVMVLGTGDSTTVTFTGRLTNIPVKKGSVFIFVHGGNNTNVDKDGVISGNAIASGTVNYITGAISVTLNTPLPSGKEITVRWVEK